jgi:hypothetical protein
MATAPSNEAFVRTYNSLSGVDIKAVFHNKAVVPLQAISYAVQREKAPVYTMGYPDPRAFSRGKRGIAGTLIFAVFDTHALVGINQGIFKDAEFYADREEIRPSVDTKASGFSSGFATVETVDSPISEAGQEGDTMFVGDDQRLVQPWYSDQIPPFDITLTGANELGTVMSMKIIGVEILNEGYGISIDDLMSEMQMTYVARAIIPWTRWQSASIAGPWKTGVTLG